VKYIFDLASNITQKKKCFGAKCSYKMQSLEPDVAEMFAAHWVQWCFTKKLASEM
jgi:hypothetical protein